MDIMLPAYGYDQEIKIMNRAKGKGETLKRFFAEITSSRFDVCVLIGILRELLCIGHIRL